MLTNKFVLCPMVSDELCVALKTNTNGLTVVSCQRFEKFLNDYKNDLLNNQLESDSNKRLRFVSDMQKFLLLRRERTLWITLEGVMVINSDLRIRNSAIAFEATNENMMALNTLHNNLYADLNLTIEEMIEKYPLTSHYLGLSNKIWKI